MRGQLMRLKQSGDSLAKTRQMGFWNARDKHQTCPIEYLEFETNVEQSYHEPLGRVMEDHQYSINPVHKVKSVSTWKSPNRKRLRANQDQVLESGSCDLCDSCLRPVLPL